MIAVIPARYSSTRLEGKLLLPLDGKPLILHTLEKAKKARNVSRVIVATDDERIRKVVGESGNEAVMTSPEHKSGSDRIAEVAENLPEDSIIVNVQGDEPLISPETIEKAVDAMLQGGADIVTICEPLTSLYDELLNFNVVKVVVTQEGWALYFSRSPMPFPRDASLRHGGDPNRALEEEPELLKNFKKHIGLYVYTREYLLKFTRMPQTRLEKFESLEQLRALENGAKIKVVEVAAGSIGVDTKEDFEKVRQIFEEQKISFREGNAADISGIARVYLESWQEAFSRIAPQEFLDNMSVEKRKKRIEDRFAQNSYKTFVAEDAEKNIVGFIDFGKPVLADVAHEIQIYSFYFLPEFQRKGFGGELFKLCLKKIADEGYSSVCLDSFEVSPYRKFYDKMGGRVVGEGKHDLAGVEHKTIIYGWNL